MNTMTDRLLAYLLWSVVLGMITATAGAALWLAYVGVLNLCSGEFASAGLRMAAAAGPGLCCWILCRNGNDLMDR